jgi:NTP pyrophosphatase (non-canonical NTP hydrolase)
MYLLMISCRQDETLINKWIQIFKRGIAMVNIIQVKIDPDELKVRDKLEAMFELNKKYLEMLQEPLSIPLDSRNGQEKLRKLFWYMVEELFEAINALKNDRDWVKTEYELDLWRVYDEIADALGFFITICRYLKLDPDKLYEIYLRKWKVNVFRVNSQY